MLPIDRVARPTPASAGCPGAVPAVGLENDGLKDHLFNYPKSFCLIEGQIGEMATEPLAFSLKLFRQERPC
jgi:hypothetical protein